MVKIAAMLPIEFPVPRSSPGDRLLRIFLAIGLGASVLAVWNLIQGQALIASCLWLSLMAAIVITECWREKFAVDWLGGLWGARYVECGVAEGELRFGFRWLGRQWIEHRVALAEIESVTWGMGQASSMVGRDMNDWHVALWHRPALPRRKGKPGKRVHVFGPEGALPVIEKYGLSFVGFLRELGVPLEQGEKERQWVRPKDLAMKNPETRG